MKAPGSRPGVLGLLTAEEVSPRLGISPERLLELAAAGYAPHLLVDSKPPPRFHGPTITRWVEENLFQHCAGQIMPRELVVQNAEAPVVGVPRALELIQGLRLFVESPTPGVIYFLVSLEGEVVYVGQSTNLQQRLAEHRADGKKFERVFYLPLPSHLLNQAEADFIGHLGPRLNGTHAVRANTDAEVAALREKRRQRLIKLMVLPPDPPPLTPAEEVEIGAYVDGLVRAIDGGGDL